MTNHLPDIRGLAELLLPPPSNAEVKLLQGVVAAVYPGQVDLYLSGGSFAVGNIRHLSSYRPKAQDVVWILKNGPDLVVLGQLDSQLGTITPNHTREFRGTSAERVGTLPTSFGVVVGDRWFETNTLRTWMWDGAAWLLVAGPSVYMAAQKLADQAVGTSATSTIVFNTELEDTDNAYSPSTGIFTVPVEGIYSIATNIRWSSHATGHRQTLIRKNGTTALAYIKFAATLTDIKGQPVATVARLAVNDTISVDVLHDAGVNINVESSGGQSSLRIARIGY